MKVPGRKIMVRNVMICMLVVSSFVFWATLCADRAKNSPSFMFWYSIEVLNVRNQDVFLTMVRTSSSLLSTLCERSFTRDRLLFKSFEMISSCCINCVMWICTESKCGVSDSLTYLLLNSVIIAAFCSITSIRFCRASVSSCVR